MSKTDEVVEALRALCAKHDVVIQGVRVEEAGSRTLLYDGKDVSMGPGADDPHKNDLALMHAKSDEIRRSAFMAIASTARMDPEQLPHTGYKTVAAAVVGTFQYYAKQLDKVLKDYLRRYPD